MFAILALAGDAGCLLGPSIAGAVAELWDGSIQKAFLLAIVFPAILALAVLFLNSENKKMNKNER